MKRTMLVAAMMVSAAWLTGCGEMPAADSPEGTGEVSSAFQVGGLIGAKWNALNGASGPLGAATSDESTTTFNDGRFNTFVNGRILWKFFAGEAFAVYGQIDKAYGAFGWEWGMLGFPETDEFQNGNRRENRFDDGNLYWKSSTGAWPVMTALANTNHLATMGRPAFSFTFPSSETNSGCFKNGSGVRFAPNSTVKLYLNNPDGAVFQFSTTTNSSGSWSFSQSGTDNCIQAGPIKTISGIITFEARDSAGNRAVAGAFTGAGNPYSGTP